MGNTSQASQRIAALLDENSFVEIGALVSARATDFNLKPADAPSDGVITGYGLIDGVLVYVYSQDASVLGGSIGEMHAKKICRLYDMALKMGAPVIGLLDCAGVRLQEATDALNGFGEIYARQAAASGVIPQITAIFGSCGGGLALIPALTDFTFMEGKKARLFVNSPNALAGNEIGKCDTSSADFQAKEAGLVDYVGEEGDVLGRIRALVALLPSNNEDDIPQTECADDPNRSCPDLDAYAKDASVLLSRIADDNEFFELKADYAKDMVVGFLRLNGATVGAVANRSEIVDGQGEVCEKFDEALSPEGCEKAARFVSFCDAFDIPVLTVTDVAGFAATKDAEKRMARSAAGLTYAFASATVPKVNVVAGQAFGSAYVAMNSKAIGADITIAWPQARIGTMDARLAAKVICGGQDADAIDECAREYEALQNNIQSAARRGYVDQIVEPADTRKYVIGAFEMLYAKREDGPARKHGAV